MKKQATDNRDKLLEMSKKSAKIAADFEVDTDLLLRRFDYVKDSQVWSRCSQV